MKSFPRSTQLQSELDEVKHEFLNNLKTAVQSDKKGIPHGIKYRGEFIQVGNGKFVWPSKGAAKNALINYLGQFINQNRWKNGIRRFNDVCTGHRKELTDELLFDNKLEIVPFTLTQREIRYVHSEMVQSLNI